MAYGAQLELVVRTTMVDPRDICCDYRPFSVPLPQLRDTASVHSGSSETGSDALDRGSDSTRRGEARAGLYL